MLKMAFKDQAIGIRRLSSSFHDLKGVGRRLMMSVLADSKVSTTLDNIKKVQKAIHQDSQRTIDNICRIIRISHRTFHKIATEDLNMQRVAAKFVLGS